MGLFPNNDLWREVSHEHSEREHLIDGMRPFKGLFSPDTETSNILDNFLLTWALEGE